MRGRHSCQIHLRDAFGRVGHLLEELSLISWLSLGELMGQVYIRLQKFTYVFEGAIISWCSTSF